MRNLEDMKKSDNIMSSDAKEGTENIPDIDKVISELVNYASENELIEADDIFPALYICDCIVPISVSNAADDESPAPIGTSLVINASNAPVLKPFFLKPAITPLTSALVVEYSSLLISVSDNDTSSIG